MPVLETECVRCEQCGALLEEGATFGCLNCLLGGGFSELRTENRRFQHYELCLRDDGIVLDELGRGAMGITYRARDLNLDSPVALKVISAAYSNKPEARERFRREARAAAQLRHPNVASVFHFGETADGQFFYVMELVEGETLEARVRRDGILPPVAALEVAEQVCRALIAAEAHGLVHRDLKPSNLMVVANEFIGGDTSLVKVIDFGLAQAVVALQEGAPTDRPSFSGTPEFASPEQFDPAASVDARSDIYSLGATLWYLLCGRAPFAGNGVMEVREGQIAGVSDPGYNRARQLPMDQLAVVKVPAKLAALLHSMLATKPEARPQSPRALLAAIRACREAMEARARRKVMTGVCMFLALGGVGAVSYLSLWRQSQPAAPPEKSIAVLPFENLSANKEDAYFATGVQDEVLSDLAKIADLKVISRTSVSQYQGGAPRNIRKIGQALGVAHVLEGSVQRAASRVRVNAQLIDTRTDAHLWAETYDRDVADVFAIQSEIAQRIARQLQAKISPRERGAMIQSPTKDLAAYNLYVEAIPILEEHNLLNPNYLHAVELLNQAVARDPKFLLAYCRLADAHDGLYLNGVDRTPSRLESAKAAIDSAFRLQPDSGEAHLALARHLYHGYLNYDQARDELDIAIRTLPNDSRIYEWSGLIDRRQNRWHDAVRNLNHAVELDPRNVRILTNAKWTYWGVRDYKKFDEILNRIIALRPNDRDNELDAAWRDFYERADTGPLHAVVQTKFSDDGEERFRLPFYEHDAVSAERALVGLEGLNIRRVGGTFFSPAYLAGLVARMRSDDAAARIAFAAARPIQEEEIRNSPHNGPNVCVLGLIDAALGRKEEALREGRRALDLSQKDYIDFSDAVYYYGVICLWVGERDLAVEQLQASAKMPDGITYGEIRLDPHWDLLRGDPRFEKIVSSLAPKQ